MIKESVRKRYDVNTMTLSGDHFDFQWTLSYRTSREKNTLSPLVFEIFSFKYYNFMASSLMS